MTADMTRLDPEELTARIIERLRITATATYGAQEIPNDFRDSDPTDPQGPHGPHGPRTETYRCTNT